MGNKYPEEDLKKCHSIEGISKKHFDEMLDLTNVIVELMHEYEAKELDKELFNSYYLLLSPMLNLCSNLYHLLGKMITKDVEEIDSELYSTSFRIAVNTIGPAFGIAEDELNKFELLAIDLINKRARKELGKSIDKIGCTCTLNTAVRWVESACVSCMKNKRA